MGDCKYKAKDGSTRSQQVNESSQGVRRWEVKLEAAVSIVASMAFGGQTVSRASGEFAHRGEIQVIIRVPASENSSFRAAAPNDRTSQMPCT